MQKLISDTFYDPKYGMQSATKLYNKLRDKGITLKQVKDLLRNKKDTS